MVVMASSLSAVSSDSLSHLFVHGVTDLVCLLLIVGVARFFHHDSTQHLIVVFHLLYHLHRFSTDFAILKEGLAMSEKDFFFQIEPKISGF